MDNNLPVLNEDMVYVSADTLANVVRELMLPVFQPIGKMLENNAAALEQLSASQSIQNDRLEALEKQIRLQTPVTSKQVSYLNESIRARARELLEKRGVEGRRYVTKLAGIIRRAVLARYGIGNMREIPRHEYNVAMSQIGIWNDALRVRDVVKEARSSGVENDTERAKDLDGTEALAAKLD